jgi:apolipoprotein D and lipocalin family protein
MDHWRPVGTPAGRSRARARPRRLQHSVMSIAARLSPIALALALTAGGGAVADAPAPTKPVVAALYSGRWYEIARTSNARQQGCQGPTSDFFGQSGDAFIVAETCHKGSASGPSHTIRTRARVLLGSGNAKFTMSFLGGLIHQQYWILDRTDDGAWALMATPGGRYIWLLARRPVMNPAAKAAALARISDLGYEPARLIFPSQQAH